MENKQKIDKQLYRELVIKYTLGFIISLVLFIVFLVIGNQVKGISDGVYFDKTIIAYINSMVTPNMKRLMIFISFLGSAKFYVPGGIILILYFLKKQHYISVIALVNALGGSAILNFLVKGYYTRIRPEKFFQIAETGFSFPSGHSMVAISSYFILTYLLFRKQSWNTRKTLAWIFTLGLVLLIGFSRIYLGVHWPTDVIGGFSLGFIWVYANIIIIELLDKRDEILKSINH